MTTKNMDASLDAIQVFANSANTVQVFDTLAEGPATSRDLAERTGAARSTIGRILERGESREWIESVGSRYELTRLGQAMSAEFRDYLRAVEGIQHLGEDFQYLPERVHELEYHHLRDATIIRPTPAFPSAPFDRMEELIRTADRFPRVIARTVTPQHEQVTWDLWTKGKEASGGVLAASFFETVRTDPERAKRWYEWAQTEEIWLHEDPLITVLFSDEVALIGMGEQRESGVYATGVLESENPAVLSWAESLFEEYRAESELLTPELFE